MKISASIYANAFRDLFSLVYELEQFKVDWLHIDVTAENENRILDDLLRLRRFSTIPFDLHMAGASAACAQAICDQIEVARLSYQWEIYKEVWPRLPKVEHQGIAVHVDTHPSEVNQATQDTDFLLLMTTTPGKSGGGFSASAFDRIRSWVQQTQTGYYVVDGGVNAEVAFILRTMGIEGLVSGSFLVNHENLAQALIDLRSSISSSRFAVRDYMIKREDLPLLTLGESDVVQAVEKMDAYGLGFVLVEDEEGALHGVMANGDLRKGLLASLKKGEGLKLEDSINRNPLVIASDAKTEQLLHAVRSAGFPVLFMPVVEPKTGRLEGVVVFNQLIKTEG